MHCVLLVAAGAGWESRALSALSDAPGVMVLKRCVDVDDLLAAATAGQAGSAVVGLDSPGLDGAAVDHLRRNGVRTLAVVPAPGGPAAAVPEAARLHASRLGIDTVLTEPDRHSLPEAVLADPDPTGDRAAPAGAGPDHPPVVEDDAGVRPHRGRVVAVWGPRGAPGRTTVACGLAAELARRGAPTVLVDADPWGGAVAQHLGVLDEVSGVLAAARLSVSGTLGERFGGIQRRVSERLTVVTGLPRPDRWVEVRAGVVEHLLETARERAQVVVDTGFSLEDDGHPAGSRPGRNAMTLGALAVADEVVVVGAADPVGLSRLARALVDLRDVTGGRAVRVVVNRDRPSLGWSEHEIAGMVEGFTRVRGLHFLPEDRVAADRALTSGRTLPESGDSALARALAELADAVLPPVAGPDRSRRRRRVRRRTAGTARPR